MPAFFKPPFRRANHPATQLVAWLGLTLATASQVGAQLTEPVSSEQVASLQWPTSYRPTTTPVIQHQKSDAPAPPYLYHTRHFRLTTSKPLNPHNAKLFAATAESVPAVLAKLPLPLLKMPQGKRANIYIYPDEASFIREGGSPNAAGTYVGKKSAVLLRADTFLTPPPRQGSKLPPKADYDLLVHEFTHLCMHGHLGYLPIWFSEGTAEYLAAAHQSHGRYDFSNMTRHIRDRIKQHLPQEKGIIKLPSLSDTLKQNHQSWQRNIEQNDPNVSYQYYASSLLIVHGLFHGGPKRLKATTEFVNQCHNRKFRHKASNLLLPSETHAELEQRIITYWRPKGLHIQFTP
ncbi:hypothetical protein HW115_11030 [Verrucomicrobiaceae bacterium N1E253]|uniref:DUF1570 domain-containing protein n=1 Tax=Oceaniferula marina TaxID=2748318 RepID=A0A851GLV6_9BACT|nr:hypothetical protein [Oceaniferula marina]NWK56145.1 hypothetical protein [Oceaniferula marina]